MRGSVFFLSSWNEKKLGTYRTGEGIEKRPNIGCDFLEVVGGVQHLLNCIVSGLFVKGRKNNLECINITG
jgi:hypothetical protein